jgi:hypothetical protein
VMSLYSMCVVGIGPFGSLAAGAFAGHFGPRLTMALGGVLSLTAGALFGRTLRRDGIA